MSIEIRHVFVRNDAEKSLFERWLVKHGFSPSLVCVDYEETRILFPTIRTNHNLYEGQVAVERLMAIIEQELLQS